MKITTTLLVCLLVANTLHAQNFEWAKAFGGSNLDYGVSIKVDVFGNVYTTGMFEGTVDFDPGAGTANLTSAGGADIFVQKMDVNGNFLWAKTFGGVNSDYVYSVSIDAVGNAYTTGHFEGTVDFDPGTGIANLTSAAGNADIFVQKMDADGNFLWAKVLSGTHSLRAYSNCVDANGNVYTTGFFQDTIDCDPGVGTANLISNGIFDVFVQKMDANGNFLWAKSFGGTLSEYSYSINIDAAGNVYTVGLFRGTADFDPGIGTANLTATTLEDIFVQKMDANGNFLWARAFGGNGMGDNLNYRYSISTDASGNVYTTGFFAGIKDFDPGTGIVNLSTPGNENAFVQKMDSAGNFLWAKAFGNRGYSISIDAAGDVYTTGDFAGTVDFDPGAGTANLTSTGGTFDIFVHKMNAAGDFLWVKSLGGLSGEIAYSISPDADKNIYITGRFALTTDFDPGVGTANLTSKGSHDVFVQKMSFGAEVNGYVFIDANGNGVKDTGEIPLTGQSIIYINRNYIANTNDSGFFRAFAPVGTQNFTYLIPPYYTNTTPLSQSLNVQDNVIDTLYFGIQPIANINDLEVQIHPYTFPRPGFTRSYQLSYRNVGTTTLNNVVLKFLKSSEDTLVSATGTYTVSNDTIIWNLGTLPPFASGNLVIVQRLSASATVGDSILTQAWITPVLNDTTPQNNTVALNELIIGSYDPNDKSVSPETLEPTVNNPLEYTIRFQNTGNYQADFVVVKDTLDTDLDLNTFQMIAASHAYRFEIKNRIATWTFPQINLPDSTTDEPGSHGFIKFRVNRISGLGLGTQIPNSASIYFDYNPPILTNTCVFTIATAVGLNALGENIKMTVYPNPTSGAFHIAFDQTLHNVQFTLTDLLGKVVYHKQTDAVSNEQIQIDAPAGIYFLSVKTPSGQSVFKLVKE